MTGASGKPAHWSTWWILDGSEDATALRAVDVKAKLNAQVADIQAAFQPWFHWDDTMFLGMRWPRCNLRSGGLHFR